MKKVIICVAVIAAFALLATGTAFYFSASKPPDRGGLQKTADDYIDLGEKKFIAKSNTVFTRLLHTGTGEIVVTLEEERSGVFYLYEIGNEKECIQSFTLDANHSAQAFTNLSVDGLYYIVAGDIDPMAFIRISDD